MNVENLSDDAHCSIVVVDLVNQNAPNLCLQDASVLFHAITDVILLRWEMVAAFQSTLWSEKVKLCWNAMAWCLSNKFHSLRFSNRQDNYDTLMKIDLPAYVNNFVHLDSLSHR
ncbi:hypothetical protein ACFE04_009032 [Oxalis oulophora]